MVHTKDKSKKSAKMSMETRSKKDNKNLKKNDDSDSSDNDDDMSFGLFDEEYDDELYKIIKKLGYNLHTNQTNKGKN